MLCMCGVVFKECARAWQVVGLASAELCIHAYNSLGMWNVVNSYTGSYTEELRWRYLTILGAVLVKQLKWELC